MVCKDSARQPEAQKTKNGMLNCKATREGEERRVQFGDVSLITRLPILSYRLIVLSPSCHCVEAADYDLILFDLHLSMQGQDLSLLCQFVCC